jgi:hypothetical protein
MFGEELNEALKSSTRSSVIATTLPLLWAKVAFMVAVAVVDSEDSLSAFD